MHCAGAGQGVDGPQSAVQYPPLHAVPVLVACAAVQSPEAQSVFPVHASPSGSSLPPHAPVAALHVKVVPQLHPWRQSGRQTVAEHT
jgi:hypothetical protein